MSTFKKYIIDVLRKVVGKESAAGLILRLAGYFDIDLYKLSLNRKGILNYSSMEVSGEHFFVKSFIKDYFKQSNQNLTFFDIGANTGKYTKLLHESFPAAMIYTFEPNPNTYEILSRNFSNSNRNNIQLVPLGLSSIKESKVMTSYSDNPSSSQASLHQDVFSDFHHANSTISVKSDFSTVDDFCLMRNVNHINLLKIDTEGHELEVLRGARQMLEHGKIDIVQFEFGECHVYSRVFLRDFYKLLKGFKFYRLASNRLIPLGEHSPANEIFQFQNIVAVSIGN